MKDPAFLFYPSDFLGGVSDLTMEERGQYITLLCIQHEKGVVSEKTIRLVLGCFWSELSEELRAKFETDENGGHFNPRLRSEIEKRAQFIDRQRERGKKGGAPLGNSNAKKQPENNPKTSGKTTRKQPLLENENVIENINGDIDENREKGGTGGKEKKADVYRDTFETFRRAYDGKKRGLDTEFDVLKKHKDWRKVVLRLPTVIEAQGRWREEARRHGAFVPGWPNLQTWLNQRRWEEELNFNFEKQNGSTNQTKHGHALTDDYLTGLACRAMQSD